MGFKEFQNGTKYTICHTAFAKLAKFSKHSKEKIYEAIRRNDLNINTFHEFSSNSKVSEEAFTEIKQQLVRNQVKFNKEIMASFVIPNTISAAKLLSWFEIFFNLIGDKIEEEKHLDCCPKEEFYEEFSDNMKQWFKDSPEEILGFSSFLKIWDLCFPHVRVRDRHKIGSKCKTCERLSSLRNDLAVIMYECVHLNFTATIGICL